MADDRGQVRLRSNVVTDGQGWRFVPGELLAVHRPDLLRRENRPNRLQLDEHMYYAPCAVCGRRIDVIMREGCGQCSDGPTELQRREAQELHLKALEAVTAARRELAAGRVAAKEVVAEPQRCIVPGCGQAGVSRLNVQCQVRRDGTDPHRKPGGETVVLSSSGVYAPLCEAHVLAGATITILYEPDGSEQTTVRVIGSARSEDPPIADAVGDVTP